MVLFSILSNTKFRRLNFNRFFTFILRLNFTVMAERIWNLFWDLLWRTFQYSIIFMDQSIVGLFGVEGMIWLFIMIFHLLMNPMVELLPTLHYIGHRLLVEVIESVLLNESDTFLDKLKRSFLFIFLLFILFHAIAIYCIENS